MVDNEAWFVDIVNSELKTLELPIEFSTDEEINDVVGEKFIAVLEVVDINCVNVLKYQSVGLEELRPTTDEIVKDEDDESSKNEDDNKAVDLVNDTSDTKDEIVELCKADIVVSDDTLELSSLDEKVDSVGDSVTNVLKILDLACVVIAVPADRILDVIFTTFVSELVKSLCERGVEDKEYIWLDGDVVFTLTVL